MGGGSIDVDLAKAPVHRTIYENPRSPDKAVEPYDRKTNTSYLPLDFSDMDITELTNGGRLLDEKTAAPLTPSPASLVTPLFWMDIDRRSGKRQEEIAITRVVEHHLGAMEDILIGLGRAMGLTPRDAMTLAETIGGKINPPLKR